MSDLYLNEKKKVRKIELGIVAVLSVYVCFGSFLLAQTNTSIDNECHTIRYKHEATSEKYGSPFNFFSDTDELMMKVSCDNKDSAIAHIGSGESGQYIYKYGYHRVNGDWEKIRYTGEDVVGPWIIGSATAEILGVDEGELGKVAAYVCQKYEGRWKCGCGDFYCKKPKWQVQEYEYIEKQEDSDDEDGSEEYSVDGISVERLMKENDEDFIYDEHPMTLRTSGYHFFPGDTISMSGYGFDAGSRVDILWEDEVVAENLVFKSESDIKFTVPNMEPGRYEVTFKQGNIIADPKSVVWIKEPGNPQAPEIYRSSDTKIDQGSKVTLYGIGFTPTNNDVVTSFETITGIHSENGSTISFTFDPFSKNRWENYNREGKRSPMSIPLVITVVNTSGLSNRLIVEMNI